MQLRILCSTSSRKRGWRSTKHKMASEGASNLTEMTSQLSLSDSTAATQTPPGVEGAPPTPGDHTHQTSHDSIPQDSEGENEDDSLGRSTGDEVGQLLRATVEELETALQESRKLLADRDEELVRLRSELDHYKQQAAREIANKTKLAQALDRSHSHASELEELLQKWQLEVRDTKLQGERMGACLQHEQSKVVELEKKLHETSEEKGREIEQLKSQLVESRQKITQRKSSVASDSNPGPGAIDQVQLHFLKQAIYHLLTDFHAEDQLRAILSILDFGPQERKLVYAKVQEKKGRMYSRNPGIYM